MASWVVGRTFLFRVLLDRRYEMALGVGVVLPQESSRALILGVGVQRVATIPLSLVVLSRVSSLGVDGEAERVGGWCMHGRESVSAAVMCCCSRGTLNRRPLVSSRPPAAPFSPVAVPSSSQPCRTRISQISDTNARQSLMIKSTGRRLRVARAALAQRLRLLVAKSALNQLGGDQP